ncbi:MAG: hypothetical protein ACI90V_008962, partial [Bacillariaceae sp.]
IKENSFDWVSQLSHVPTPVSPLNNHLSPESENPIFFFLIQYY